MRMKRRKDGFWVTVIEGNYGDEGRRVELRAEATARGRAGAPKGMRFFDPGMSNEERSETLLRWR